MPGKTHSEGFHGFQEVDSTRRPDVLVDYLDTDSAIPAVQAYKEQSYEMLRLKPGHHVIDVGCGTGDDARAISRKVGSTGRVVGIDNSEVMITEAKKRSLGNDSSVEFRVGSAFELPFDDDTFHVARAERIFQHLSEPEVALREMIRVTRSGGTIGVIDPDWDTLIVDSSDRALTRQILASSQDSVRNPWMGRQLYTMLGQAGLENLRLLTLTVPILKFSVAEQLLNLDKIANRAVEKQAITGQQTSQWLGELKERDGQGHFFSAISGFGVFGTKPDE